MQRTIAVSLVLTFALVVVAEVGQAQTQTPPGSYLSPQTYAEWGG